MMKDFSKYSATYVTLPTDAPSTSRPSEILPLRWAMSPARKPMKNFVMNVIQLSAMYSGFVKSNSILPKPEARPPVRGPNSRPDSAQNTLPR